MANNDENFFLAYQTFHPLAYERQLVASNDPATRFVHYTSAEGAQGIIANNEVWMRSASCMNDYREAHYGFDLLNHAFRSDVGKEIQQKLDSVRPGLWWGTAQKFDTHIPKLAADTFLFCVSEHLQEEDQIGRLSMWRAYGSGTAIGVVLKAKPFFTPTDALGAYTSPVAYLTPEAFMYEIQRVKENVAENLDFLKKLSREELERWIFELFVSATVCTKHPGFKEEREWRVVFTQGIDQSSLLQKETRVINGTPQPIYKIPLTNVPDKGLSLSIPEVVERVIIGPTNYADTAKAAVVQWLASAGVDDAEDKVIVSDIPIRR